MPVAVLRQGDIALGALFAAGLAAGVAQVLLMRELMVVAYGNELSMGLLLACWLFAGAIGSALEGRRQGMGTAGAAASRMALLCLLPGPLIVASVALTRAAPMLLAGIAAALPAAPASVQAVLGWLGANPGEMLGPGQIALIGALATAGPAALNGAQFAAGCDLLTRSEQKRGVGPAWAADATGHLLGGVALATTVLIVANPFAVALWAGFANAAAAAILLQGSGRRRPALAAGIAAVAMMAAWPAADVLASASTAWRWHNREVLASVETRFANVAITRQQPDGIYVYENGLYSGASPPLPGTIDDLVHITLAQHPRPARVLLVACVELDERLLEAASRFAAPGDRRALTDQRVTVIAGDGRAVIQRAEGRWDAIVVALPDPATAQLNRFYTAEFYDACAKALTDDGVVGWEIPGAEGYFSPALLRLHTTLLASAEVALSGIARVPGESTVCVAGRTIPPAIDSRDVLNVLRSRGISAPWLETTLPERLQPTTLRAVENALAYAPKPSLNHDLRPIGYFLDQLWWVTQFQPGAARLLDVLSRVRLMDALIATGVILSLLMATSWYSPVRRSFVPLVVAGSGFVSMSLEVALLFAFQSIHGYVYGMVGVIIGAFMVGVALGAIAAEWQLRDGGPADARAKLTGALVGLALVAAGIALALGFAAGDVRVPALVFPLLTGVIGLLVGMVLPLATRARAEMSVARSAAGLYAADLVGAAAGALLAGALLAPVLGLPGTCALGAAVCVSGVVLLMIAPIGRRVG